MRQRPGTQLTGAGLALALVSAVAFGLSGPFAKALIDAGWSANGAVLVRLGGAALVLAVVLAVARPGVLVAIRRDGGALLLYGLLAMAGVQVAFFNAVRYLPVPVALLLEYTGPVLVIGWVWVVRRQPPSGRTVLGAGVALVGLTMVVQIWNGVGLRWEGLAWGLLAAVCQASYFLIADRTGVDTPPLVLAGVGMGIGAVIVGLLGLVGLLPVVIDTSASGVVLAGADVGWPAAAAALLEVAASAVASWLLLGQAPTPIQAAGGVLILAGVALTQTARPVAIATAPA